MQPRRCTLLFFAVAVFFASSPAATMAADPTIEPSNYPSLLWQFETRSQITDAPIIAGGVLLQLSEDGYLYALDPTTGAERWRAETGHAAFERAHVTADDNTAYISDTRGRLRAIDVATGETLWRRQTAAPKTDQLTYTPAFPPATVVDSVVYVDDIVGNDGVVYALNAKTGKKLWDVNTAPMESYPLPVVEGVVYVSDLSGNLWFIDAATGERRARYQAGETTVAAPFVGEGMAFLALGSGRVDAIQPDSGERQWSAQLSAETENVLAPVIVGIANGILYVSHNGRLFALDVSNGQTMWEIETYDYPTVGDGIIYVADGNGSLIAVDATSGVTVWHGPMAQGARTVAGDTLYAAVGSSLVAFDGSTGQERWRVRTGGMVYDSVTVTDDSIFLGSTDHFLYALSIKNQTSPPEGFAGISISVASESLATVRLEPLPEAPAFLGIWRITVPGNVAATIPALTGPAAGFLESGSLDFPDAALLVAAPDGFTPIDSVDEGATIRLPLKTPLAVKNSKNDAAEVLVFAVLPEDGLPETGEQRGVTVDLVGGGMVETLPGDGAFVDLGRAQLDPGTALVPTLSAWPDLFVVVSGSLDLAVENTATGKVGMSQSEVSTATTIATGHAAVLPAGRLRFARAGEESTSLLVLSVSGNIHTGQGGGCGGRCIQTTR